MDDKNNKMDEKIDVVDDNKNDKAIDDKVDEKVDINVKENEETNDISSSSVDKDAKIDDISDVKTDEVANDEIDINEWDDRTQEDDAYDINISGDAYSINEKAKIQTKSQYLMFEERNRISPNETNVTDYESDKIEKRKQKEHKKRNRIKAAKNKRVFRVVWVALVILVGFALANYLTIGANDLFAVGRPIGTATVEIPEDVSSDELSQILYEADIIAAPEFFKLYCDVTANMDYFGAGVYNVKTNYDYEELINYLQIDASKVSISLLFREGLTVLEMAELLDDNKVCDKDEFLEALNSGDFDKYDMIDMIDNEDDKYYKLEGYLFPDTYDFDLSENLSSVIGKFLYNFQQKIDADTLEKIESSKYSLDEIIIIASIIQGEAANDDDMSKVSAVIHNRLEKGASADIYSLGMDSTYYYPYKVGDSDIPSGYVSDYETDTSSGLPEGAICNPGMAAIKAALNPDSNYSNAFYFCHDADGKAYYASTFDEHLANLEKAGLA